MQEITRCNINETQIQNLCTCSNETMDSQLLVKLFSSSKLYHFKVTFSYSKYTWISKHSNWLCTLISPSWYLCGCLHKSSFINGSWRKQRRMGNKSKQINLWTQAINCKLVWSSKNWSREEGLPSISSWPYCILQKILSYFNLCWFFCNSLIKTRYRRIIGIISK